MLLCLQHLLHILRAIPDYMEGVHKELIAVAVDHIHHCVRAHLCECDSISDRFADRHHDCCGYVGTTVLLGHTTECPFTSQYSHGEF